MFEDEEFEQKMKEHLAPVISNHLGVSLQLLSDFSAEILNKILTSLNIVPNEELRKIIIINATHPEKIPGLIDEALGVSMTEPESTIVSSTYDECLDLRAGILAIVPEDVRDEVEKKINKINDVERLVELSQKPVNELLVELGIGSPVEALETEEYDEKRDIIAGILAMVPDEELKEEIEEKLNEIDDVNEIVKLATMEYTDFLRELGIETNNMTTAPIPEIENTIPNMENNSFYEFQPTFSNRPSDIRDDIKAGILARLPDSIRTFVEEKIMAIDDLDTLIKLSTMNYIQIQNELGIPVSSPALAPPSVINPVDTAARYQQRSSSQTGEAAADVEKLDEYTRERLRKRNEEIEKLSQIIIKIVEKVAGKDLPEDFEEKIKILKRIYPDRLRRLVEIFKAQKKKKRILLMFEWFVISQRIEEIETYVEHWQGAGPDGAGGFRASISVSRYDSVIEHLKDNEINQIIKVSKQALNKIHDSNLQVRAVGVEEIKSVANILLHKIR
ncbi:MAG: hypothetical protein ACTSPQ_02330 [Candidatus Helarchaeota archaeon]